MLSRPSEKMIRKCGKKKSFCDLREIKLTVFCVVSLTGELFFFVYEPCNIMTHILILSISKLYLSTYNSHCSSAVIFLQMFISSRWLNFNSNLLDINTPSVSVQIHEAPFFHDASQDFQLSIFTLTAYNRITVKH